MCIVFTAAQGVSTAYIMKRLDNIVKLYAQSISSILMTIACTVFFPLKFSLEHVFIASFILTIIAIFLYEHANFNWKSVVDGCQTYTNRLPKSICGQCLLALGIILTILMLLLLYAVSQSYGLLPSEDRYHQNKNIKHLKSVVKNSRKVVH